MKIESLGVIVSPVNPADIESGLSCEPPDPDWIVPRALHHEQVLRAALEHSPVLPTRFGCVFASEQSLEQVTGQHRELIGRFLSEVADQEEWTIKAYLDETHVVDSLLRKDPRLSERFRKLPAAPGARYFLEKKLREEARTTALRAGKAAAALVRQAIEETGAGVKVLPSHANEADGPSLLLKVAVLIPRGKIGAIVSAAEQAPAKNLPLVVESSGPWPPYHFCPIIGEPTQ